MRIRKKIKKVSVLCLIFLLSINSLAAIVSDNDGSAFVTKAEFDALRNSFSEQIDSYNDSIDGKIDGAIAAYLDGIRTKSTIETNLLFPVAVGDINKVLTVPNKYNGIRMQSFQGGIFLQSWFAMHSINDSSVTWQPFTSSAYTTQLNWTQHSILGESPYDQMEGWTFASTNPDVLIQKWEYDNCNLNLAITSTQNQNWGHGGNGERWLMGLQPGYFTGKYIDVLYSDINKIGHRSGVYGGGTPDTNPWLVDSDVLDINTIYNYWSDTIPIPNSFKTSHARITQWGNSANYDEVVKLATVLVTHETKNPDNNIYIYNDCHDVINAHDQDETELEEYTDYGTDVTASYEIGGYNTNLYVSNRSECWAWWSPKYNSATSKFDLNDHESGRMIGTRRNWRFTPKFKLKNTNSTVAPNTASVAGGTKYWNTLDQFRNGKLTFKAYNGNEETPHFYGGLPLYSFDASKVDEFKFNIEIANSAGAALSGANPICLQIKENEFPNSVDMSTWDASEKDKLIEFEGTEGSTKYNYDSTNKCIQIPLDKLVTITIKKPKKQSTIYLRWWESSTKLAGGNIEYLGDATLINNND